MERLHNLKHSARRSVVMLIAFLILVLAGGVSVGCFAGIAGSAFLSEEDTEGESAPANQPDSADAEELTLVALCAPAAPRPAAVFFLCRPACAARAPRPGPVRTAARLSTSATPLRC